MPAMIENVPRETALVRAPVALLPEPVVVFVTVVEFWAKK